MKTRYAISLDWTQRSQSQAYLEPFVGGSIEAGAEYDRVEWMRSSILKSHNVSFNALNRRKNLQRNHIVECHSPFVSTIINQIKEERLKTKKKGKKKLSLVLKSRPILIVLDVDTNEDRLTRLQVMTGQLVWVDSRDRVPII